MIDPKEEQRESIAADAAEIGGELAFDAIVEGAFDIAAGVGESALGLAGDVLGGIADGI